MTGLPIVPKQHCLLKKQKALGLMEFADPTWSVKRHGLVSLTDYRANGSYMGLPPSFGRCTRPNLHHR